MDKQENEIITQAQLEERIGGGLSLVFEEHPGASPDTVWRSAKNWSVLQGEPAFLDVTRSGFGRFDFARTSTEVEVWSYFLAQGRSWVVLNGRSHTTGIMWCVAIFSDLAKRVPLILLAMFLAACDGGGGGETLDECLAIAGIAERECLASEPEDDYSALLCGEASSLLTLSCALVHGDDELLLATAQLDYCYDWLHVCTDFSEHDFELCVAETFACLEEFDEGNGGSNVAH